MYYFESRAYGAAGLLLVHRIELGLLVIRDTVRPSGTLGTDMVLSMLLPFLLEPTRHGKCEIIVIMHNYLGSFLEIPLAYQVKPNVEVD